jgi:hypothetical protein
MDPTYRSLADHTEAIQIDYDPSVVSYKELLEVFWGSHNPTLQTRSSQYKPAIFFHTDEQERAAVESLNEITERFQQNIFTEILPFNRFYPAENYHQKFRLQQDRLLMAEFNARYPDVRDIISSTAAARVNGYLGGYGSPESLQKELPSFGLSRKASKRLIEILSESRPAFRNCPL